MSKRVLIIGLDCVPPKFLFDRFRSVMPHVSKLIEQGAHGPLRSSIPPITVPAWTCMVSGRDPGELGLYGFRNRKRRTYDWAVPTSRDVKVKRLWDWVSEAGRSAAALFVPLTYPATPLRGTMASGFLTPSEDSDWAFPPSLKAELKEAGCPLLPDVTAFRTRPDEEVLQELFEMADAHFRAATHVWENKKPTLMMMVEIGPDRFHHAFYRHLDPKDPTHDPDHPMVQEGFRYYAMLDEKIGHLIGEPDPNTAVMIVSDHGARPMEGGIAINEWLRQEGLLVLKNEPTDPTPFSTTDVDWARTKAWGAGGYYGRVFFNVRGREPEGLLEPSEVEGFAAALTRQFEELVGNDGRLLSTKVHRPGDTYRTTKGTPPDLMVFFDNLRLRSLGTVGGGVYWPHDDRGRDQCNHDWDGVFVLSGAEAMGELSDLSLYDIPRTALSLLDIEPPADILGNDRSRG